jgi:hypothetical protein
VGKIFMTFTPSIVEPSVVKDPLITARRLEGSSFQTMPEIFIVGGLRAELPEACSAGLGVVRGAAFTSREISFAVSS